MTRGRDGLRHWVILGLVLLLGTAAAQAARASDQARLSGAFQAVEAGDLNAAYALAEQLDDPVARKLVYWYAYTIDGSTAGFGSVAAFMTENPGWPRQQRLQAQAERAMPDDMDPTLIVAFFATREPVSADGQMKLGEALIATGQRELGERMIQQAWIAGDFSLTREQQILRRHAALLTPAIHAQRVDRLLWDEERAAATRLLSMLDANQRELARARMALANGGASAQSVISAVPQGLRADPGLLFEKARWHRRQGRDRDAWPLIMAVAPETARLGKPEAFWQERHRQARNAIKEGLYDKAYAMVVNHGLTSGVGFADAEFLAGWISLRFLRQPERAVEHFERLKVGVTFPISLARANYWLGRAQEASRRPAEARAAYGAAARFPETFYGQLAMIAMAPDARLSLPDSARRPGAAAEFKAHELTRAIRLLHALGKEAQLRAFALHFAEIAPDPALLADLVALMRSIERPALAIRVAKRAMQRQLPLVAEAYPKIDAPRYQGRGDPPEMALVLGLSRQESEFDPQAVSSAGAKGLMQLMPETARRTAKAHGLRYDARRLLGDPDYSLQLGMAHLSDLLRGYDGSYILTIAAYNAGGGRVREWIGIYGDPRSPGIDPIDWIEKIPFTETRNYVQRVLENTQVYRQRLAGRDVPLGLWTDLRRASSGRVTPAPGSLSNAAAAPPAAEDSIGGPEIGLDETGAAIPLPRPAPRRERTTEAAGAAQGG